ncbi:AAA family ATPase [Streptomyces sp. NPDC088124]|uniref:AAA family ATPase n=1 Tax=Streptomyces sp. NPDC088124 TaxID=3154654 RepID=UPI00344A0EAD
MTSPTLIRIGVMGAHSTGKTLLMRRMEMELRGQGIPVARTGKLGRRAALVPLPKMQHHTVASTMWIIATGIADEIAAAARLEEGLVQVVLADRACWDALAYFRATQEWHRRLAAQADRGAPHRLASAHGHTYDLLLATVLAPTLPVERRHDHDARYRALVDRHTHDLPREENIPYVRVTGDPASQELAVEHALQLCTTEAPV